MEIGTQHMTDEICVKREEIGGCVSYACVAQHVSRLKSHVVVQK